MYKLLKSNISSAKFLSVVFMSVFVVSATSGPTAFAGSPPSAGSMTTYDDCQTKLSQKHSDNSPFFTNAEIKAWGTDRVSARDASLDKYNTLRHAAVVKSDIYDKGKEGLANSYSYPRTLHSVNSINHTKEKLTAKLSKYGVKADPQYDYTTANIPARLSSPAAIGDMNNKFNTARGYINDSKAALNNSGSSRGQLINAGCRSVFLAQVYSSVYPAVKSQYILTRLDTILVQLAENQAQYNGILSIDSMKKSVKPDYAKGTTIQDDINSLKSRDPAPLVPIAQRIADAVPTTKLKDGPNSLADQMRTLNVKRRTIVTNENPYHTGTFYIVYYPLLQKVIKQ